MGVFDRTCSAAGCGRRRRPVTVGSGRTLVTGDAPSGAFVRLEPTFAFEHRLPTGESFIDQSGQMFIPGAPGGPDGQTIQFRSSENVLHNVRVIRRRQDAHLQRRNAAVGGYSPHIRRVRDLRSHVRHPHGDARDDSTLLDDALHHHRRRQGPLQLRRRRARRLHVDRIFRERTSSNEP